jgi:drug/metabolite transporter (DMT)-like permease
MFSKYKYHLLLHVIIFMWGFTGILGKIIHIDALNIVWFRVLIAFVSLFFALKWLGLPRKIADRKTRWKVFGVGIIVAVHWMTFYTSIQLSTASLGILCLSTTTLHVTWLEPLIMKKRFSWVEFGFGLIVVLGIYIVSSGIHASHLNALYIGLFSALCAALFSVFNAKIAEETPASAITLHEMGIAFLFISVIFFAQQKLTSDLFKMSGSDLGWLLFLGIACTSFAFLATIEVMKKLGAFTVSLSINLEPVYTILLAIPILHEDKMLSGNFYWGSLLILLLVIANGIYKRLQEEKTSYAPKNKHQSLD